MKSTKYRPDIDGIRAIAIISVIGYHAFPGKLPGGFIGVDIFFVISGFLITGIITNDIKNNTYSIAGFYARRIRRIFPSLVLILAATLAFGWLVLFPDEYGMLGKHAAAGAGFLLNFILLSESGYFDAPSQSKPLLHLWSLAVEEQFYIIWPIALWFTRRRKDASLFLMIASLFLASFAINIYLTNSTQSEAYFSPLSRFWELMTGGLLALLAAAHSNPTRRFHNMQAFVGFIVTLSSLFLIRKESSFPGWYAMLPTFGAVLLISAGPAAWINRNILSNCTLVKCGLISYPLYLWHWPILSYITILEGGIPSRELKVAAIALAIVLSWVTYKFIEKPIRLRSPTFKLSFFLSLALSLAGISGFYIYKYAGIPERQWVRLAFFGSGNDLMNKVKPDTFDPECKSLSLSKETKAKLHCIERSTNSNSMIAIYGDSHASASYTGLSELLSRAGIDSVLLTSWGCPQLIGVYPGRNEAAVSLCKDNTEKSLEEIRTNKKIKQVIIFSRGRYYLTGKNYWKGEFLNPELSPIPSPVFIMGLQKTINSMREAGKNTYYVTENPELGLYPKSCLKRPFKLSSFTCDMTRTEAELLQSQYLDAIKQIQGTTIINSLDTFCNTGHCSMFSNGQLLYRDSDHLSVEGSLFQAYSIMKYIRFDDN